MDRVAMFDVAEAGAGPRRFNTDGYKLARLLCRVCSQGQTFLKGRSVRNNMIGWKHDHRGSVIASRHPTGTERNGRSGVALGWFRYNILLWKSREQLANCRFLFGVCQDQNAFARGEALKSCHGFLEERSLGDEAKELFRSGPATQRPKAFTTASGENERVNRIEHVDAKMSVDRICQAAKIPVSFFKTRRIW